MAKCQRCGTKVEKGTPLKNYKEAGSEENLWCCDTCFEELSKTKGASQDTEKKD